MVRSGFQVVMLLTALFCVSCLTSTLNSISESVSQLAAQPQNPASARIGQINDELASIAAETSHLESDYAAAESQRNESFLALGELHGIGPKAPKGAFDETLCEDPGMLITMHNQNLTIATRQMQEISGKTRALGEKAAKLKAERAQLEATASQSAKAPASVGCFTPDTHVLLEHDAVPISTLSEGRMVMVFNETTGQVDYRPVLKAFSAVEEHYYLLNGDIRVTGLHRFLTDEGWIRVCDLKPGMKLKTIDGWKPLETIKLIQARVKVHNLEVDEHHDFFVSGGKGGYLVHNTGGGGK